MTLAILLSITTVTGLLAGLMAGLLGLSGGIIVVPVLFALFSSTGIVTNVAMPMALATTLAVVVIITAAAAMTHRRIGNPVGSVIQIYLPWLMLGAFVASQMAELINQQWLVWIFPTFLLYVAARLGGFLPQKARVYSPLTRWQQYVMAFLFGTSAIFLGLSGGVFLVPHFVKRHHLTMAQAVGTATACGTGTAFVGMLGYMLHTAPLHNLPGMSTGYVYWPAVGLIGLTGLFTAPLGAKLAKKLPDKLLKSIFAGLLVVIAVSMWLS